MDPILLNEMLTSLRIIRDEISELRETGAAKSEILDRLNTDVIELSKKVETLQQAHNQRHGAKSLAKYAWHVLVGVIGVVLGILSQLTFEK